MAGLIKMYLEKINLPQDIKKLKIGQLPIVADELRRRIIEVVSMTGGHLASSLGAVELTLSLHYCLNLPEDKIIWDVGHQSYSHKILTGRNKQFSSLRQYQGLSGFPNPEESVYDVFATGHSGTAISLALGLAVSNPRAKIVAVIGDGSLSNGLCFEGLNNAGHLKSNLLVVLNTNELSIAPNAGALSIYLNKIISLPIYNRFRSAMEKLLKTRIPRGQRMLKIMDKFEEAIKSLFVPGILFEELGFRYFGPFDGHNLETLIPSLKNILKLSGPRLFHIVTVKGKGYSPAEREPVRFHSALPFDIPTGQNRSKDSKFKTYTEIFSQKLIELSASNPNIVAITAAMPEGTGLDKFRDLYPDRFFDVGIAESHAVCFAAGLSRGGLKPVIAVYSSFLQRAYDQIIEEAALQNLSLILAVDRAGIVGADGVTHQGIFDLVYLRSIPNLVVMAPSNCKELEWMLEFALGLDKTVVIRYPKSACPLVCPSIPLGMVPGVVSLSNHLPVNPVQLGKAEVLREGNDVVLIALGAMVLPSLEAADLLEREGISCSVINARFLKPLDIDLLNNIEAKIIFTVEEGVVDGGFGSAVQEVLGKPIYRIGLPNEFIQHGSRDILLKIYGLTSNDIAKRIIEKVSVYKHI
ncbi:MAG: 1-deoxy-D-xylulose-5-phosphate synthase [Candidatus Omnitrophota bacterium]